MERSGRRNLWGWGGSSRRLLGIVALALTLSLGLARWKMDRAGSRVQDPSLVVDLNHVPPQVLRALPRLGAVLTARIVAERERRPFISPADLDHRVRGVGPSTVAALRPYLRFSRAVPAGSRTLDGSVSAASFSSQASPPVPEN
ncbi:MAG: hypothetical protein NVSMB9_02970 [Isosphaeraceae bacterium]